ncbi:MULTISPECIES: hypothetical protein [Eikenella]|uniref:Uncharacterized protein n=1 Tax=Eikenella longinqua TaxID=1795827 RepID=A0A1A9RY82_9NEIS|nr:MULTISPECIES: hypothetical protein [Eikenella]OAM28099.1 hypothetical protein A7P95_05635 [Eikenella longinqua]
MKIISKFKDFYDHKVAKYGSDPVLVFDRRQPPGSEILHSLPKPPADWQQEFGACAVVSELYVGNLRVFLFATDKQVYSSYDIESVYLQHRRYRRGLNMVRFLDGREYCLPQFDNYYWPWYQHRYEPDFSPRRCNRSQPSIAAHRRVPLLLAYYADPHRPTRLDSRQDFAENPQLSGLGVYFDPDIVWQHLCEYLSQLKSEAETSPPVPDKDKIGNKGFDARRSFRPKMKGNKA